MLQQMMLIPCTDRQLKDDSMLFQEEKQMKLREKSDVRKGQEMEGNKSSICSKHIVYRYEILKQTNKQKKRCWPAPRSSDSSTTDI